MADIKRNTGTPQQMEKGQAQALNEGIQAAAAAQEATQAQAAPQEGSGAAEAVEQPPAPETPQDGSTGQRKGLAGVSDVLPFNPQDDDDRFLFGPTERPDEPVVPMPPVPDDIEDWLPLLRDAALQPGAPRQLHDFLNFVAAQIGPA